MLAVATHFRGTPERKRNSAHWAAFSERSRNASQLCPYVSVPMDFMTSHRLCLCKFTRSSERTGETTIIAFSSPSDFTGFFAAAPAILKLYFGIQSDAIRPARASHALGAAPVGLGPHVHLG